MPSSAHSSRHWPCLADIVAQVHLDPDAGVGPSGLTHVESEPAVSTALETTSQHPICADPPRRPHRRARRSRATLGLATLALAVSSLLPGAAAIFDPGQPVQQPTPTLLRTAVDVMNELSSSSSSSSSLSAIVATTSAMATSMPTLTSSSWSSSSGTLSSSSFDSAPSPSNAAGVNATSSSSASFDPLASSATPTMPYGASASRTSFGTPSSPTNAGGDGSVSGLMPYPGLTRGPISLPPGCRHTTDLLDNVCRNPILPPGAGLGMGQQGIRGGVRSALIICPLPGEEEEEGGDGAGESLGTDGKPRRRRRTFAVSGTITIPDGLLPVDALGAGVDLGFVGASPAAAASASSSAASGQEAAAQAAWPKEGDEGFWRSRGNGTLEWVPAIPDAAAAAAAAAAISTASDVTLDTAVQPLLLESTLPGGAPNANVKPVDAQQNGDAKVAGSESNGTGSEAAYDQWSASIGGIESEGWISFEEWKRLVLAREEEERDAEAAAAARRRRSSAESGEGGSASSGSAKIAEAQRNGGANDTVGSNGAAKGSGASGQDGAAGKASAGDDAASAGDSNEAMDEASFFAEDGEASNWSVPASKSGPFNSATGDSVPAIKDASSLLSSLKHRWNFASLDCAAVVHRTNPSAKFSSSVLSEKKDRYMLSPCPTDGEGQFIIVELCDEIMIDTIVLANYEFFSRMFKRFRVRVARNFITGDESGQSSEWVDVGTFRARNVRGLQVFNTPPPKSDSRFFRYVRIDFLEHYGSEYYCPVSLLRVYGLTQMDDYIREEEEMKRQQERMKLKEEGVMAIEDGRTSNEQEEKAKQEEPDAQKGSEKQGDEEHTGEIGNSAGASVESAGSSSNDTAGNTGDSSDQPKEATRFDGPPGAGDLAPNLTALEPEGQGPAGELDNLSRPTVPLVLAPANFSSTEAVHQRDKDGAKLDSTEGQASTDSEPKDSKRSVAASNSASAAGAKQGATTSVSSKDQASKVKAAGEATSTPSATVAYSANSAQSAKKSSTPSASASTSVSTPVAGTQRTTSRSGGSASNSPASSSSASPSASSSSVSTAGEASGASTTQIKSSVASSTSASSSSSASSGEPSAARAERPPSGGSTSGSSSGSSSGGSGSGGSESIYRTITKRLNALEANATLSSRYIEASGQMLKDVFARMEKRQEERMSEMLRALNASNWRQIESLKRRQQVDLQQAIFEFDTHRLQTDSERNRLLAEMQFLANEVVLEKRFGVAQLLLVFALFVFMALTRGSRAVAPLHLPSGPSKRTHESTHSSNKASSSNQTVHTQGAATVGSSRRTQAPSSLRQPRRPDGHLHVREVRLPSIVRTRSRNAQGVPSRSSSSSHLLSAAVPSSSSPYGLSKTSASRSSLASRTPGVSPGKEERSHRPRGSIQIPTEADFAQMSQEELRAWLGFLSPVAMRGTKSATGAPPAIPSASSKASDMASATAKTSGGGGSASRSGSKMVKSGISVGQPALPPGVIGLHGDDALLPVGKLTSAGLGVSTAAPNLTTLVSHDDLAPSGASRSDGADGGSQSHLSTDSRPALAHNRSSSSAVGDESTSDWGTEVSDVESSSAAEETQGSLDDEDEDEDEGKKGDEAVRGRRAAMSYLGGSGLPWPSPVSRSKAEDKRQRSETLSTSHPSEGDVGATGTLKARDLAAVAADKAEAESATLSSVAPLVADGSAASEDGAPLPPAPYPLSLSSPRQSGGQARLLQSTFISTRPNGAITGSPTKSHPRNLAPITTPSSPNRGILSASSAAPQLAPAGPSSPSSPRHSNVSPDKKILSGLMSYASSAGSESGRWSPRLPNSIMTNGLHPAPLSASTGPLPASPSTRVAQGFESDADDEDASPNAQPWQEVVSRTKRNGIRRPMSAGSGHHAQASGAPSSQSTSGVGASWSIEGSPLRGNAALNLNGGEGNSSTPRRVASPLVAGSPVRR